MPNHVKNRIKIIGTPEQVKEVFERFNTHHVSEVRKAYDDTIVYTNANGEYGWHDPVTDTFTYSRSKEKSQGVPPGYIVDMTEAYDEFPDFNKVIPQPDNIFLDSLGYEEEEMCRLLDRPTWYDWNRENWGTKWGAYSCDKEADDTYTFETAWNAVPKILMKMSREFPDVKFAYEYSDEDIGANCGYGTFENGVAEDYRRLKNGSTEAYQLAIKLRPDVAKYYHMMSDGSFEYKDEEE